MISRVQNCSKDSVLFVIEVSTRTRWGLNREINKMHHLGFIISQGRDDVYTKHDGRYTVMMYKELKSENIEVLNEQ